MSEVEETLAFLEGHAVNCEKEGLPRVAERFRNARATITRLSEALDWAETYDPELVAKIRERAALTQGESSRGKL